MALMISFNELAWIGFLLMSLLYAAAKLKEQRNAEIVIAGQAAVTHASNLVLNASETLKTKEGFQLTLSNAIIQAAELNDRLRAALNSQTEENLKLSNLLASANTQVKGLQLNISNLTKPPVQPLKLGTQSTVSTVSAKPVEPLNYQTREGTLRPELLGLKGKFQNVIFLVDISASMDERLKRTGTRKWDYVVKTIEDWIKYLSLKNCALIVFDDRISEFPDNHRYLDLNGLAGDVNRASLLTQLHKFQPTGYTDTLAALKAAYSYRDVDTIILFSDGAPKKRPPNDTRSTTRRSMEEIYKFCEEMKRVGRTVPINTVGLGNYFVEDYGQFLLRISEISGGTFVGR